MSNPFSNIITEEFKNLHKNMIDALLEDSALTVPCILHYASKWTDCPNCIFNAVIGKSANKYQSGGPLFFSDGQQCPYCGGEGRTQEPQTETLYLMAVWDSKEWMKMNSIAKIADIAVQTKSKITTYDNLKRATKITIDSSISPYGVADFVRVGDPQPCGLGASNFIVCSWSRT